MCVCVCVCVGVVSYWSAHILSGVSTGMVRLLLDHGASPSDSGRVGGNSLTPLHDACSNLHVEVVRVLLERGADPSARSGRVRALSRWTTSDMCAPNSFYGSRRPLIAALCWQRCTVCP